MSDRPTTTELAFRAALDALDARRERLEAAEAVCKKLAWHQECLESGARTDCASFDTLKALARWRRVAKGSYKNAREAEHG